MEVLDYLTAKGLNPKRATSTEVHLACFFCQEAEGKRGRLYVNIDPTADVPGLYMCHLCGARGSLVTIKRHFGDIDQQAEQIDDGYIRRAILGEAAEFYHSCLTGDVLSYLQNDRGLSKETIDEYKIGYAGQPLWTHLRERGFKIADVILTGLVKKVPSGEIRDFFHGKIVTIPYFVAGSVVMVRGRDLAEGAQSKYLTPSGQKARLFNSDVSWTAEDLYVCEGEFDTLVLQQRGFPAVGVPGASTWQPAWDGYIENARRVYLCLDNDNAGTAAAGKLLERFPKARLVNLPENQDITDFVVRDKHTLDELRLLLRGSGGLLVTVDEAFEEHQSIQGQVGLKLGFSDLDKRITPGLLPAQVMVLLSKSGTGKTLALLNIFHRASTIQPKAKMLFLSLEQTRGDWFERARRIFRFYNPGATDADALDYWRERLLMTDRNRLSIDDVHKVLEDYEAEMGQPPDLVAVDYLGYWARSYKGEEYQRLSDAIMALKEIAKDRRVAIIAPHQVNRSAAYGVSLSADQARGSGVIEETADFVTALWNPDANKAKEAEAGTLPTGRLEMSIEKSRHGGQGTKFYLQFAPLSLAIVPLDDRKLAQFARDEQVYFHHYHCTWEEAQVRHEAGLPVTEPDFRKVEAALWARRQRTMEAK